jgi:hypothetical protein
VGAGGSGGAGTIDASADGSDAAARSDAGGPCTGACRLLEAEYTQALAAALVCTPGAPAQCTKVAPRSLSCGCLTAVNSTDQLEAIHARWLGAGCNRCLRVCIAIVCPAPELGGCSPIGPGLPRALCGARATGLPF